MGDLGLEEEVVPAPPDEQITAAVSGQNLEALLCQEGLLSLQVLKNCALVLLGYALLVSIHTVLRVFDSLSQEQHLM